MSNLRFFEVFVDTPLEVCEQRDTKGLYQQAREGKIKGFYGIDQSYQRPSNPELILKTVGKTVSDCVQDVLHMLAENNIISHEVADNYLKWYCGK